MRFLKLLLLGLFLPFLAQTQDTTQIKFGKRKIVIIENEKNENIEVDLYGTKSINQLLESDYILSSKKINSPIQSFPLQFKPQPCALR